MTSIRERRCYWLTSSASEWEAVVEKAGAVESYRPGFKSCFQYFLAQGDWGSCLEDGPQFPELRNRDVNASPVDLCKGSPTLQG